MPDHCASSEILTETSPLNGDNNQRRSAYVEATVNSIDSIESAYEYHLFTRAPLQYLGMLIGNASLGLGDGSPLAAFPVARHDREGLLLPGGWVVSAKHLELSNRIVRDAARRSLAVVIKLDKKVSTVAPGRLVSGLCPPNHLHLLRIGP